MSPVGKTAGAEKSQCISTVSLDILGLLGGKVGRGTRLKDGDMTHLLSQPNNLALPPLRS